MSGQHTLLIYAPAKFEGAFRLPHSLQKYEGSLEMIDLTGLMVNLGAWDDYHVPYLKSCLERVNDRQCVNVWFTGSGYSEVAQYFLLLSYQLGKNVAYLGSGSGTSVLVRVITKWFSRSGQRKINQLVLTH